MFSGLNDKELKQLIKVKTLLHEKMVPKMDISLNVSGVCEIKSSLESADLLELFEFMILMPDRKYPDAVNRYLSKWKQNKCNNKK